MVLSPLCSSSPPLPAASDRCHSLAVAAAAVATAAATASTSSSPLLEVAAVTVTAVAAAAVLSPPASLSAVAAPPRAVAAGLHFRPQHAAPLEGHGRRIQTPGFTALERPGGDAGSGPDLAARIHSRTLQPALSPRATMSQASTSSGYSLGYHYAFSLSRATT